MNRPNRGVSVLGAVCGLLVSHIAVGGQDVEMLGRMYGTTPPAGYYQRLATDPTAFRFSENDVGPLIRSRLDAEGEGRLRAALQSAGVLGPRGQPVLGPFAFPLVLALYSDSPEPPYSDAQVQAHFFDGPNPTGTIPELYHQMSAGRVQLSGTALPWVRTGLAKNEVAGGSSGLGLGSRVGPYIREAVEVLDSIGVDWGSYDNDGPDGMPNSGDDDGIVDVLTVVHPTPGGECPSADRANRVWSHRWRISSLLGSAYQTRTPAANGGFVSIDDYTIQPVLSCDEVSINEIGVFAHELGHGFGLPDLYAVGGDHGGAGQWDLMGTGSWGCPGVFRPERPCSLGAWSRAALGWVDVVALENDLDHGTVTLGPVQDVGTALLVPAGDGLNEFLLLENRQRAGPDADIPAEGLLIWHIDQNVVDARWAANSVNFDAQHMGVWLRQADGANHLGTPDAGRGDSGDVFTGQPGSDAFHAGTIPGAWSHGGGPLGITLLEIRHAGPDILLRALTRYQTIRVRAIGAEGSGGLLTVDGVVLESADSPVSAVPFQALEVEAAPGALISPGRRTGFQGWEDGSERVRTFTAGLVDSVLTATYGGTQVRVDVEMSSPAPGIEPGSLTVVPGTDDGWGPAGALVEITAVPRTGFEFLAWQGALAGEPNPALRVLDAPVSAQATFGLTFSLAPAPSSVEVAAARELDVAFHAANANQPVEWTLDSGILPQGTYLDPIGLLRGAPMETGTFSLDIRATDAIGLTAVTSFELIVDSPDLSVESLTMPFLSGGTALTSFELQYLDRIGNDNGSYDLGDLRGYLLSHPNLPMTGNFNPGGRASNRTDREAPGASDGLSPNGRPGGSS